MHEAVAKKVCKLLKDNAGYYTDKYGCHKCQSLNLCGLELCIAFL